MIALKTKTCPVVTCWGSLHEVGDHYECMECGAQVWAPEDQRDAIQIGDVKELMQPEGLIIKGGGRSSGRTRKKPQKKPIPQYLEV